MSTPLPTDTTVTPDTAHALLFDCDGTLVDSVAVLGTGLGQDSRRHGVGLTPEWCRARAARADRATPRWDAFGRDC